MYTREKAYSGRILRLLAFLMISFASRMLKYSIATFDFHHCDHQKKETENGCESETKKKQHEDEEKKRNMHECFTCLDAQIR